MIHEIGVVSFWLIDFQGVYLKYIFYSYLCASKRYSNFMGRPPLFNVGIWSGRGCCCRPNLPKRGIEPRAPIPRLQYAIHSPIASPIKSLGPPIPRLQYAIYSPIASPIKSLGPPIPRLQYAIHSPIASPIKSPDWITLRTGAWPIKYILAMRLKCRKFIFFTVLYYHM